MCTIGKRILLLPAVLTMLGSGVGVHGEDYETDLDYAQVISVRAHAEGSGTWRFEVTVEHNDTGWDHYADACPLQRSRIWWSGDGCQAPLVGISGARMHRVVYHRLLMQLLTLSIQASLSNGRQLSTPVSAVDGNSGALLHSEGRESVLMKRRSATGGVPLVGIVAAIRQRSPQWQAQDSLSGDSALYEGSFSSSDASRYAAISSSVSRCSIAPL